MNDLLRRLLFLPEQASTFASDVDQLHFFVIAITMLMSAAVGLTALAFFIRYRRKSEDQTTPHIEPSAMMEAAFVGIPLAIFLGWFGLGFRQYVRQTTPPPNAMDVYVMGKKWMWKFSYPEGPNAVSELRVPAGRPVRLLMTSRDVIHSFFVPAFRVKQDVLPARYTQTWFEATVPGHYPIYCAQYCGNSHSMMRGEVIVMPPEEYDEWIHRLRKSEMARQDTPPVAVPVAANLVEQGKRLAAEAGCFKCHTIDGTPHIGPTWLGMFHRKELLEDGSTVDVDEGYITESMMDPLAKIVKGYKPVMPSFQGKLAGPESAAIVEYIKSLQSDLNNGPSEAPVYAPVTGR